MQFYTAVIAAAMLGIGTGIAAATGLAGIEIGWPSWSVVLRCILVAFTASCGHWLVYTATTRAGAAVIAPMAYVQLLVALAAGWLVFDDWPDTLSMVGGAMIVCAGLYLWRSGRARAVAECDVP
jgi:drug/metabolite transporter (DMT)-like permease